MALTTCQKIVAAIVALGAMWYVGKVWILYLVVEPLLSLVSEEPVLTKNLIPPEVAEEISGGMDPDEARAKSSHDTAPEETQKYSAILRKALESVARRDFTQAEKWLARCSDRRKVPANLLEVVQATYIGSRSPMADSALDNGVLTARGDDVFGESLYNPKRPRQIIENTEPPVVRETPGDEGLLDEEISKTEDADQSARGTTSQEVSGAELVQATATSSEEVESVYDPYCVNRIGEYKLTGMIYEKDFVQAVEYFVEAANVGNEEAQYNIGILFANILEEDPHFDILMRIVHGKQILEGGHRTMPKSSKDALSILYLYAASTAGHPGALMAMGYRHNEGFDVPKICSTAALNYIEVAKGITEIYSSGMPQAVELIRLNLDHKKNKKMMSEGEINLFTQIASSGDTAVAAAIGKRYLLGIDGFKQNYSKALEYLRLAAQANHGGSFGLLGYMYALGLGVERNLETAHQYFVSASLEGDALGQNGLGFIYFHGTTKRDRNVKLAFQHFNESSYGGSADGMFNLASVYLTGVGVEQSFQKAVLWYTQALDRGHTPAAYSLAIMHLNGVGTVRDCSIAVNLLKRVCERGSWVSSRLQEAYGLQELDSGTGSGSATSMATGGTGSTSYTNADMSAFLFLQLAEAGHEVAQMNLAHLLDIQKSSLAMSNPVFARFYAQRFYELSADQGSASSELRLGDYAYYGWLRSSVPLFDNGSALPAGTSKTESGENAKKPSSNKGTSSSSKKKGSTDLTDDDDEPVADSDMLSGEEMDALREMGVRKFTSRSKWSEEELLLEAEWRFEKATSGGIESSSSGGTPHATRPRSNSLVADIAQRFYDDDETSSDEEKLQNLPGDNGDKIDRTESQASADAADRTTTSQVESSRRKPSSEERLEGTRTSDGTLVRPDGTEVDLSPVPVRDFDKLVAATKQPQEHFDKIAARHSHPSDMESALAHYWKVSNMQVTSEWMQHFVARASFNLGFMYQFGLGIPQDLTLAKRLYQRSIELDPATVTAPVTIVVNALSVHKWLLELPTMYEICTRVVRDPRTHVLILLATLFLSLVYLVRPRIKRRWTERQKCRESEEFQQMVADKKDIAVATLREVESQETAQIAAVAKQALADPRVKGYLKHVEASLDDDASGGVGTITSSGAAAASSTSSTSSSSSAAGAAPGAVEAPAVLTSTVQAGSTSTSTEETGKSWMAHAAHSDFIVGSSAVMESAKNRSATSQHSISNDEENEEYYDHNTGRVVMMNKRTGLPVENALSSNATRTSSSSSQSVVAVGGSSASSTPGSSAIPSGGTATSSVATSSPSSTMLQKSTCATTDGGVGCGGVFDTSTPPPNGGVATTSGNSNAGPFADTTTTTDSNATGGGYTLGGNTGGLAESKLLATEKQASS